MNVIKKKTQMKKKVWHNNLIKSSFILTTLLSAWLFSTTLYAQDNTVILGSVAPSQLRIKINKGGNYCVYRYIGNTWQKQFFAENSHLFAIKIGKTLYSSDGTDYPASGSPPLYGYSTAFTKIEDIGTPVTTGVYQEMTKRFTGKYDGSYTFSVTLKIMYNTSSPDYLIKQATIDATNIPSGTSITFAYGWDTYVNTSDKGYAYIVPDIFNLNNNLTEQNRYLTTAQVQSLRMVGASNTTGNGALIAFFPIGRNFDRAYSANPYKQGHCYNLIGLIPGNGTGTGGADNQYKFQFGHYSTGRDNGTGVGYDNIPAGKVTEIKTGLTFTSSLDGELDYFWNGAKNHIAHIGETVHLNMNYLSYNNSSLNNVGFRVDFPGLQINASGCTSSVFTGGTTSCTVGANHYQLSGATVPGLGNASVSIPVNTMQAGQWVVDGGSITNTTQALPLGSPATLTISTTVSLVNTTAARINRGQSMQYVVKFPGTVTAAEDVTINLTYLGNTAYFSLPSTVTIPAGSNSATFTVTALPTGEGNDMIRIMLNNTNKVFVTVEEPASAQLTIAHEPVKVEICQGDSITLVATPTNGGDAPSYQWKKNNVIIDGATNARYTYLPENGDSMHCEMTLHNCPFPVTVYTPTMVLTVNQRPGTPVMIVGADTSVYDRDYISNLFLKNMVSSPVGGTNVLFFTDSACTIPFIEFFADYAMQQSHTFYAIALNEESGCTTFTKDALEITVIVNPILFAGTVFPFVYHEITGNENQAELEKKRFLNAAFPIRASLYAVPDINTLNDPIEEIRKAEPLFDTIASYYDGSAWHKGIPKSPGEIANTNNPGVAIHWNELFPASSIPPVDSTYLGEKETPQTSIGIYTFKDVPDGKYILVLSREGYITRFAEIEIVRGTEFLQHRELIAGDMTRNLQDDNADVSEVKRYFAPWDNPMYEPKHDLNADGQVDEIDLSITKRLLGFSIVHYSDTRLWMLKYKYRNK